jgi:hypothetical protein
MVTQEKSINYVVFQYRLGTVLIWIGVLTWAPFIFLRATGNHVPFLWFLPFHLIGVIGGSRLRALARRELGLVPPGKSVLHTVGHVFVLLGILVWVPYLYSKLVMGQTAEVMHYLPYHLAGVLGGVALHVLSYLMGRRSRQNG